jgi:hypothetical protein
VITDPLKIILNFGWTSKQYINASERTRSKLRNAKALSFLAQYPGCPILTSLCRHVLRVNGHHRYKLGAELSNYEKKRFVREGFGYVEIAEPTCASRQLMSDVFGFSLSEQLSLERYFDELNEVKAFYHPVIIDHCSSEQFDYYDRYVRHHVDADDGINIWLGKIGKENSNVCVKENKTQTGINQRLGQRMLLLGKYRLLLKQNKLDPQLAPPLVRQLLDRLVELLGPCSEKEQVPCSKR